QLAVSGARQRVQAYNPQSHMIKAGTPTMGGLLFCAIAVVAWLVFDRSRLGFVVVFALGAGGLLDGLAASCSAVVCITASNTASWRHTPRGSISCTQLMSASRRTRLTRRQLLCAIPNITSTTST